MRRGESNEALKRRSLFTVQAHFNGSIYEVEVLGKHTFKDLRERLRSKFPTVFTSDMYMKKKMNFLVRGSTKTMNQKGRAESSGTWSINSDGAIHIDATLVSASSRFIHCPSTEAEGQGQGQEQEQEGQRWHHPVRAHSLLHPMTMTVKAFLLNICFLYSNILPCKSLSSYYRLQTTSH